MVWIILETFVLGLTAIVMSFFVRTRDPVHKVAILWAKLILFASRIKVSVNGLSNIDLSKSYIYMCNHQSNFDIPVLLSYLPVQFRWLAKAELFKIPIFGRGMRAAGYISIDRFNRASAFESLGEAAEKIKGGVSVMIFPEEAEAEKHRNRISKPARLRMFAFMPFLFRNIGFFASFYVYYAIRLALKQYS